MNAKEQASFDMEDIDGLLQDAMGNAFSGDLIIWPDTAVNQMLAQTKLLMGTVVEYKELMMMYNCAMKEVRTKFDVLNAEFKVRYQRNPIASTSTRLKKTASIIEKLNRQDFPFSLEGAKLQVL